MAEEKKNAHYILFNYWIWVFLYCILIFYLSSRSVSFRIPRFRHGDKVLHVFEYCVLSFVLTRAFIHSFSISKRSLALWAIFITICYGTSDELHQHFVPARHADIVDVLFDALGAIIGNYLYFVKEKIVSG